MDGFCNYTNTHTTITVAFFVLIETNQMLHAIEMRCAVQTHGQNDRNATKKCAAAVAFIGSHELI